MVTLLVARKEIILKMKDIGACGVSEGLIYTGQASFIRFKLEDTTLCFGNINVPQSYAKENIEELTFRAFRKDRGT